MIEPTPAGRRSALDRCLGSLTTLRASLCITFFALVIYGQTLHFDFVNFDDDAYVVNNPHVLSGLSFDNIRWSFSFNTQTYWHPLVWISLMLDASLYGQAAAGYHLTNLLLHIANAVLVFSIFNTGTRRPTLSLIVALLFTVHPLNVESVAWVVERKNLLSSFFFLLTSRLYLAYASLHRMRYYWLALIAFICGLMSKPSLVIAPVLLLLLDVWPLGRFRPATALAWTWVRQHTPLVVEKIPFVLASIITFWIVMHSIDQDPSMGLVTAGSLSLRIQNALVSYLVFIGKLFLPLGLACYYPFPSAIPALHSIGAGLAFVCITSIALFFIRKAPYLAMGWAWYVISLLPASGLIQAGLWPARADRFVYIPLIGLLVALVALLDDLRCHLGPHGSRRLKTAGVSLILILTGLGWQQTGHWRNGETLFTHAVKLLPDNFFARNNLGNSLLRAGRYDAAIEQYHRAIAIAPDYALTHNNLGVAYSHTGRRTDAILSFRKATSLSPRYMDAHMNLGVAYYEQGDMTNAAECFRAALLIDPESTGARQNLETVRRHSGIAPESPDNEDAATLPQ